MNSMIAPLLLSIGLASQPPAPAKAVLSQQQQQHAASQQSNSTRQNPPTTVTTTSSTPISQPPAPNPTNNPSGGTNKTSTNDDKWWAATLPDWIVAIFAIVVAVISGFQWRATHDANKHTAVIERAYVDISHQPPGIVDFFKAGTAPTIKITVKNHGRTPATIISVKMGLAVGPGPNPPFSPHEMRYGLQNEIATFLMPNGTFHQWMTFDPVDPAIIERIEARTTILWVIGNVEYMDSFGKRHRGGYARRFIPTPLPGTTNNLVFETTPGYNYDTDLD